MFKVLERLMRPKYFDNLHVAISAITGQSRIAYIDPKKPNQSDKYIDIPEDEWFNTIMSWIDMLPEGKVLLSVHKGYSFLLGGNLSSKEELIKALKSTLVKLEQELPDREEEDV